VEGAVDAEAQQRPVVEHLEAVERLVALEPLGVQRVADAEAQLALAHRLEVHPEEAQHRAAEVDAVVVAVVPQRQQRHRRNSATVSIKSIAGIAASLSSSKIMLSLLMHLRPGLMEPWLKLKNCSPTSRSNMW